MAMDPFESKPTLSGSAIGCVERNDSVGDERYPDARKRNDVNLER